MQTLFQDLRYGWRQLRRAPEVTILAIITLALGIGANTAMFTVVESVLLRPLPYAQADRLISISLSGQATPDSGPLSLLDYRDIREQARTLDSVAAYSTDVGVIQTENTAESVITSEVTPHLLEILGARALLGGTFGEGGEQAGGLGTVMLSEGLWRKLFNGDPTVVGRSVRVNGESRTVLGVMPRSFRFPETVGQEVANGLWLPIQPRTEIMANRSYRFVLILAKLRSGVRLRSVQAELDGIAQHIREIDSRADHKLSFRARPYLETITGPVRPVLVALLSAVILVLLIACANVANLLVVRCLGRQHEFAVRSALGSGQMRLIRQMIAEAGILSSAGSALGLFMAYCITGAVHALPAGTVPRAEGIGVHWSVVTVLALIATVSTLLSALLPAMFVARTNAQRVLQANSRSVGAKSVKANVSSWIVAGEVALSALLLIATGLLFRTLWSLEHRRLGFDTSSVTSFSAMPADAAGFGAIGRGSAMVPRSVATSVYQPLLENLRRSPGIQDAVLVTAPPLSGFDLQTSFRVVGWPVDPEHDPNARITALSAGYDRLLRTPILRGRGINENDTANAPFVVTINEALAKKYFRGRDPLGQQLEIGGKVAGLLKPYTIIGIVEDQIATSTSEPPKPSVMLPYQQIPVTSIYYPVLLKTMVYFVVKARGDVAVAPQARAVFHRLAPDLALANFRTMQEAVDKSNFGSRLSLYMISTFASLAVVMVVAGLYGVLSQIVRQRGREFGLRMALGATRQRIIGMVLRRGLIIITIGLLAGIALAAATAKLIGGFLYGVTPLDSSTYLLVAITLIVVGILAALLPAWRAASFQPVKALRDE